MSRKPVFLLLSFLLALSLNATAQPVSHWVQSKQLSVHIAPDGSIDLLKASNGATLPFHGTTALKGCLTDGPVKVTQSAEGAVEVRQSLLCEGGTHQVTSTEQFLPTATSIRWNIQLQGSGKPWSTPIQTVFGYKATASTRFWLAWSNPDPGTGDRDDMVWKDPLTYRPMTDQLWHYGGPAFDIKKPDTQEPRKDGGLFSIPMATILEPKEDRALSIIFSPEDQILDANLQTTAAGGLVWSSLYQRIGNDRVIKYSLDIVLHEADWRGGLRWISQRYPNYFNADLPIADKLAGGGSYSTYEGPIDAEHLRKVGFRTNWKGSFDFPYMGMFLPPVPVDEHWNRFAGGTDGDAKQVPSRYSPNAEAFNGTTSIHNLADYSSRMKKAGFYVLNYFNTTEFGAKLIYPQPPTVTHDEKDRWKDANDFLYANLKDAVLFVPHESKDGLFSESAPNKPHPYKSWGGAFAMDMGEPKYQEYLLEQARRHLKYLPDSSGFCIDRLDWLRIYNFKRDDGVSWVSGYPAESLYVSFKQFMERLSPIVHGSGKVLFSNNAHNHDKRLDLMQHFDGMYDELGHRGASLNLMAFLTIRKSAIAWTPDEKTLQPDPDAFFQRNLYMGVYPTSPVPGNDHTILPGDFADKWYSDYAPLFDLMRERKWVLTPHPLDVQGEARANLFTVGNAYVMPVVFGGAGKSASVSIHHVANGRYKVSVLHPGISQAIHSTAIARNGTLFLTIPLKQGCGMVSFSAEKN